MTNWKHFLPIAVALGAPVLFISGVIIFVVLASASVSPEYDFIYTDHRGVYEVDETGRVVRHEEVAERLIEERMVLRRPEDIQLWRYDVDTDQITELSYGEARDLTLFDGDTSPDGYRIEYRRPDRSNIFGEIFGGRAARGYYIYKNSKGRRLDIDNIWSSNLNLVGWVEAGQ